MILGAVFGAVMLFFILNFSWLLVYGFTHGPSLDKESKAWVDAIVPQVVSKWNADAFLQDSSSELKQTQSKAQISQLMTAFSNQFGPMKKYEGSTGQSLINVNNFHATITAEYRADIVFANGSTTVDILGIKENGQWKILTFLVQ